jgi:hypothetical protein
MQMFGGSHRHAPPAFPPKHCPRGWAQGRGQSQGAQTQTARGVLAFGWHLGDRRSPPARLRSALPPPLGRHALGLGQGQRSQAMRLVQL